MVHRLGMQRDPDLQMLHHRLRLMSADAFWNVASIRLKAVVSLKHHIECYAGHVPCFVWFLLGLRALFLRR